MVLVSANGRDLYNNNYIFTIVFFSVLLISVFLCISLLALSGMNKSAAWFANSASASANGMSVFIKAPKEMHTTVKSYAVKEIEGNTYSFINES